MLISQYKVLNSVAMKVSAPIPKPRWMVPTLGRIKLNCDASCLGELCCGLGCVFHDHNGSVVFVAAQRFLGSLEADGA